MTDLKDGSAVNDFLSHLVPVATFIITLGGLAGAQKAWKVWSHKHETEEEKEEQENRHRIDRIDERNQNDLERLNKEISRKDLELEYYRTQLNEVQTARAAEREKANLAWEAERSSGVRWYGVARGWYFYAAMIWEQWQRGMPGDRRQMPGFETINDPTPPPMMTGPMPPIPPPT